MSRTFKEIQNDIRLSHTKNVRLADDEELDQSLVSQAESQYARVARELESLADHIAGMKPDHAESNQELRECIAECKDLLREINSLRYIGR